MKYTLFLVCCMAAAAFALDADAGHFIPKGYYTIDANGHQTDVHPLNPHIAHYLRRLRRETVSSASSSSSSSSSSGDGKVYFSSQQVVQHTPSFGLASRFGGEPASTGHIVSTSGVIGNDGKIYYQQQQGQFQDGQYHTTNFKYPN